MDTETIPTRLKQLRKARSKNITEFAEFIEMPRDHYSKIESGRGVSITTLVKIADKLGVNLDYLTGRTNISIPYSDPQFKEVAKIFSEAKEEEKVKLIKLFKSISQSM